ncbi:MAG: rod shape-determining protein RodA [Patescibacteria group bacterium]|jgi:rod shape determining protein RodA
MALASRSFLRNIDWPLLAMSLLLVAFGLAAIFSITLNQDTPDLTRFWRQILFIAVGLVFLVLLARMDYRFLSGGGARILYISSLVLLVAVLLFGSTIRGATAWFTIGGFSLQPVEFVKIIVIIALARVLAPELARPLTWRLIGFTFLLAAIPIGLVMLQPDLGSATVIMAIWLGMLIFARISFRKLLLLLSVLLIATALFGQLVLTETQRNRFTVFFSPEKNCLGDAWNFCQSVTAVGSGQVAGRGLGLGSQSQLNFLPEQETDFIFAVIAEEMGLIGSGVILILFLVLFWRFIRLLRETRDGFAMLVIGGILVMFFSQMFVNIGMNIGILPIAGIPLPFVSYGGSSLLASLIAVGIIESIASHTRSTATSF